MAYPVVKTIFKVIADQWKLSLFVLLFLPLLIRLGFWQLDRAEERRQLLAVYQYQQHLAVENVEQLHFADTDIDYRPVRISGRYHSQYYWLLDNQVRAGKVGYEVIMPLQMKNGQWLLVNRGWVAAPRLRSDFPVVDTPNTLVSIEGYFYPLPTNAIFNSSSQVSNNQWPKRVLEVNLSHVENVLGAPIYPRLLRINDNSPGALVTNWPVVNTSPEKHNGYAMQWFLMAFALVFLYAWAVIKKDKNNK